MTAQRNDYRPRRRSVLLDLAVCAVVFRRARRRGLSLRVSWFWARESWADLVAYRTERGIEA